MRVRLVFLTLLTTLVFAQPVWAKSQCKPPKKPGCGGSAANVTVGTGEQIQNIDAASPIQKKKKKSRKQGSTIKK